MRSFINMEVYLNRGCIMVEALKKLLKFMFKSMGCLFMVIGFIVFVITVGIIYILNSAVDDFIPKAVPMPDNFSLTMNVDDIYEIPAGTDVVTAFSMAGNGVSRQDVIKALRIAADDGKVDALYVKMNDNWLGLADTGEIRELIEKIKKNGKNTEIYSEVIGLSGTGASAYYLASVFDKIWLQPTGEVNFTGISLAAPFFKGLLDKIGVQNEVYSLYEYKSGAEAFTEEKMSEPVKENLNAMLDTVYGELLKEIALSRRMPFGQALMTTNEAPLSAQKALESRFVDKLGYFDEFIEKRGKTIDIKKYIAILKTQGKWYKNYADEKNKVAVINISGLIVSGSQMSQFFPEDIAAADDVAAALREAADDENVKAIVLNINSGGGSYTASDVIRHAVEKIKQENKLPVVAYLRGTAASGAYFVATAADRIVATPFTITGSIGVFGGKPVVSGLMQKLGINVETINRGDNADMMGITKPFTTKQEQEFKKTLEAVYADFTDKVAESRNLNEQQMDDVARGRIFSGIQAVENGLIDETGTWDTAMEYIANEVNVAQEDLNPVVFPKPKTSMDLLMDFLSFADLSYPTVFFDSFKRQMSVMNNGYLMYDASVHQVK